MIASKLIEVLGSIISEHGDLEVELLETKNGNTLPKHSYEVSVSSIDGSKFIDISDVWVG